MEKELVSVIVPVYNVEKYLEKCLDSLLNQTYTNLQIILINDGSKDGSEQICQSYAKADSRILFLSKKNEGVSVARNAGLKEVKGTYLAFVDSDDYVQPEYIENLVRNIEGAELSICGFNEVVDGQERPQTHGDRQILNQNRALELLLLEDSFRGYLWNKLFRADVVRRNLIQFEPAISVWEDVLFVCEYLCEVEQIVYDPAPFYQYVYHERSASHGDIDMVRAYSALIAKEKIAEMLPAENKGAKEQLAARFLTSALNILRMDAMHPAKENKTYVKNAGTYIRRYIKRGKHRLTKPDQLSVTLCQIHPKIFELVYRMTR